MILGLTGSLGSGKTFVSSLLKGAGALTLCADQLARQAVLPGTPILQDITRIYGTEVLAPGGGLDRAKMASIVFNDPGQRQLLEGLIHPWVRQRELEFLSEHRDFPLLVIDIPLLFETGFQAHCDATLVVLVTPETRETRLQQGRSMSREDVQRRLATQLPQAKKAEMATFLVDNSGNRQYTCNQVNRLLRRIFPGALPQPLREATTTA